MRLLFEICYVRSKICKFIVASSLDDLLTKGREAFGLVHPCRIFTIKGTEVEDDEVLFLLEKSGTNYFLLDENIVQEQQEPPTFCELNPILIPQIKIENVESTCRSTSSPPSTSSSSPSDSRAEAFLIHLTQEFYPVVDIIRTMKCGKKAVQPNELIDRVTSKAICSINDRRLLNKKLGLWLMENCVEKAKLYPSPKEFDKMARSIVHYFPSTANSSCPSNPHTVWYDISTRSGTLESYVRSKRCRDQESVPREKLPLSYDHESDPSDSRSSCPKRQRTSDVQQEIYSPQEIQEAEEFMRKTPVNDDTRAGLMEKFRMTRCIRRECVMEGRLTATEILTKYQVLQTMKEAIEDEFEFLKGTNISCFNNNWRRIVVNVLVVSKDEFKNPEALEIIQAAERALAQCELELFFYWVMKLIVVLLPNKRPGFKRDWATIITSIELFFQEFQDGTSTAQAIESANERMKHPGIIKIGKQYFLKVEEIAISLGDCSVVEVIGYLLALYYVLDLNYPPELYNVFIFFEQLFLMKVSRPSIPATRLFGMVYRNPDAAV